ncbi:MAG TPA: thioredoxin [Thiotrichales bacterium]|nr:thioredoxin [Thiotrichales bacterium]
MEDAIFDVDLDGFETQVLQASAQQPVLVDLWAEWCSPCLVIAPLLQKLVAEFDGRLKLAKVEVDEGENMKLAGRYQVRGFPTVILFVDGDEVARFSGARPLSFLREFVEQNTGL